MDFPKPELSPAAQTLKHMAEQHQHKNNQYNRGPYSGDFGNYQQQNPGQQVRNVIVIQIETDTTIYELPFLRILHFRIVNRV